MLSTDEPTEEPNPEPEPAFRLFAFHQFGSLIFADSLLTILQHGNSSRWKGKVRQGHCGAGKLRPANRRSQARELLPAGSGLEGFRGAVPSRALLGCRLQDLPQYIGRPGALQMRILDPAVVGNRIGLEEVCILHQEINRLVATV